MSETLIERLFASGAAMTGKAYRALGVADKITGLMRPLIARTTGALVVSQDEDECSPFGRLRTASAHGLFDAAHLFDKQPRLFDEVLSIPGSMSSTHLPNEAAVRLRINSGVVTANSIVRQSFQYVPYQPGRAQVVIMTGTFGAAVANATKELGLFDANNGVFFRQDGAGALSVVQRSFVSGAAVDTVVAQSSWNRDRLDGTGSSGVTLNATFAQIFVIDYAWLGVGTVRFGFQFGNKITWCHEIHNENVRATVFMSSGSLPVRYSIRTTGTLGSNVDLHCICASVSADGGFDKPGYPGSTNTRTLDGTFTAIGAGVKALLLTYRLKTAYNRALILPQNCSAVADTPDSFLLEVILGGTVSAPAGTTTSVNDAVEAVHGRPTATVTGGRVIYSEVVPGGSASAFSQGFSARNKLALASGIAGTQQELHVLVTAFTPGNFYASADWLGIY